MPLEPIVAGAIVLAIVAAVALYAKNYLRVPPDRVAVITGRKTYRIVRGGATFKMPMVETVNYMRLTPWQVKLPISGVVSKEGVAVSVEAVALVRFGSTEEAIRTAAERFLDVKHEDLLQTVQSILSGHLRSILAKMTVEEINADRTTLAQKVTDEAGKDFGNIGMQIDALTIQHVSDEEGYLAALGRKRTAEVKRDADVGEAEATRDANVRSAAARQAGETAKAAAEAEIERARRDRDVQIAQFQAQVKAEQATAEQAGPLATAQKRQAVVQAEVAVDAARTEAQVAVQKQEIERRRKELQATVVEPADAERSAAILRAEGEKQAKVTLAEAGQKELEFEGAGEAAKIEKIGRAEGEAIRAKRVAEADGMRASLLAEAEGKERLAAALNLFQGTAVTLQLGPAFIRALPEMAGAVAAPLGNIDRIVMIDGGGSSGSGPMDRFSNIVPLTVVKALEALKAAGFDLASYFNQQGGAAALPADVARQVAAVAHDEKVATADAESAPDKDFYQELP